MVKMVLCVTLNGRKNGFIQFLTVTDDIFFRYHPNKDDSLLVILLLVADINSCQLEYSDFIHVYSHTLLIDAISKNKKV